MLVFSSETGLINYYQVRKGGLKFPFFSNKNTEAKLNVTSEIISGVVSSRNIVIFYLGKQSHKLMMWFFYLLHHLNI